MAILAPYLTQQYFLPSGAPNSNGFIATYQAGTTTPIATFLDSTGLFPNTNPIQLDSSGSCSLWLNPNVAYKFVISTAANVSYRTVDNVIQNQLITLYGGVDNGVVNAYLLGFTASFSSYVDGTVIYWIPLSTNTGPATLNVNGLGVLPILTIAGTILPPNAIILGQFTQVVYRAGNFYLIPTTGFISGTLSPGWTGFSGVFAPTVYYRVNGSLVTFAINGVAASNSVNLTMTGLPVTLQSALQQTVTIGGIINAGSGVATGGSAFVNGGTITFGADCSGTPGNWTASGNKGFFNTVFSYTL